MLADLDGHRPEKIEFCLTEAQKEMFKDVLVLMKTSNYVHTQTISETSK